MTLRPIPARWFELVTIPRDLARTVECLSRTGVVELEAQSGAEDRARLPDFDEELKAHHDFAKRYQAYWPAPAHRSRTETQDLIHTLTAARRTLRTWQQAADPIIAAIERNAAERDRLALLRSALAHAKGDLPDLTLLTQAGPRLAARIMQLPEGATLQELPALALLKTWTADGAEYVLAVGRHADIAQLDSQLPALKGRVLPLPEWLPSSVAAALPALAERIAAIDNDQRSLNAKLAETNRRLDVASALGEIALIDWLSHHVNEMRRSQRLAWVTGWTSDVGGEHLREALDAERSRYILRLSEPPSGSSPPSVLVNPAWVRAFEEIARMLGTPAQDEADPSVVVAVVAPILFGFMFGDVGQGFVVLLAGILLGRQLPLLRMLIPGGLSAMVFGLAFGSVFSREDIIRPLWLHPIEHPITLLVVAITIGVAVLSVGLGLDALQAHWRGEARQWWEHRAGLMLAYFGLVVTPIRIEGLAVAALGAVWYVLGAAAIVSGHRLGAIGRALAELVEEGLRLLVNTVSFARVGAFALAHAGLSVAIVEVANATGPYGYWPVLIAGNVLVIALEGLVVSIQTTRLMLFEFFIRFLIARGRAFSPLLPPDLPQMRYAEPKPEGTP